MWPWATSGSGAAASAERFFRHIGVWDEFKPQFLGYSAAATALIEGKIDAFWVLVGYPNPSVAETAGQAAVRLIDVDQTARASDFYDAYAYMPTTIPAGTYGSGQPACATFQDATLLCANRDVPDEIVHGILQRLWSPAGIEAMSGTRETFAAMSVTDGIAGVSIPMHPGAVKFWTEQGKTLPADLKP